MDDDDRDHDRLAQRFEAHRSHLRGVAYRMLGSLSEADDAVQEAWLRYSRTDTSGVDNLAGWLTRVVARVCLDMLRSRTSRRERPLGPPDVGPAGGGHEAAGGGGGGGGHDGGGSGPEDEAVLADSVGLALLVVLDRLSPPERVAFVLHDLFAVPFDEIAPIVERTPVTTKKLASRARHRVRGPATVPDTDLARHRHVVDAFLAASRDGDIEGLLAVLAPDVVRRADRVAVPPGAPTEIRGARAVAEETRTNAARARFARPALVDGAVGVVVAPMGRVAVALALTIEGDRIVEVDVIADPDRLARLGLAVLP
jgi:RNA polymerase sigma factor (sigma-70 family)